MRFVLLLGWELFLGLNLLLFISPFALAIVHDGFFSKRRKKHQLLWLSATYFMVVNVILKSLLEGFARIFFGIIALFSKSSFRIAPSILFGLFLLLASIVHWSQLENHILPMLSRHYLVIIFDILTSVVLFYHAWRLKSLGLLDNLVYTEVNSSY